MKKVLTIFSFTLILLICLVAAYCSNKPKLFPNTILGDFQCAIPQDKSRDPALLWVLSDDSFCIDYTSHRGGTSVSSGTKCFSTKEYLSLYNPDTKQVITRILLPGKYPIEDPQMVAADTSLWIIGHEDNDMGLPVLLKYDIQTGELLLDRDTLEKENSALWGTILKSSYKYDKRILQLTTSLGRDLYLHLDTSILTEGSEPEPIQSEEIISHYVFGEESGDSDVRKVLYLIKGPAKNIDHAILFYLDDPERMMERYNTERLDVGPGRVFIDPLLVYGDDKSVLILHQESIKADARRILSCITSNGSIIWEKSGKELPEVYHLKPDDYFNTTSYLHNKVSFFLAGSTGIFIFNQFSAMGLDYTTGETIWEL